MVTAASGTTVGESRRLDFPPATGRKVRLDLRVNSGTPSLWMFKVHCSSCSAPTRILPLGDSITQSDSTHNSDRRELWRLLTNAGKHVDFVGSLSNNFGGGQDGFELTHKSDGSLILNVNQPPDSTCPRSSAGCIPANFLASARNWRFFAVTYDAAGEVQFHFGSNTNDAALDVRRSYPGQGAVGAGSGQLTIGHMNPATRADLLSRVFRGLIDEVQIYDKVLSPVEIVAVQRDDPATRGPGLAARINRIAGLTDGSVRLEVVASPGRSYRIQAGPTVGDWADAFTNLSDQSGWFEWIDSSATNSPCRFYRALELDPGGER